jgi:regulatory protein
MSDLEAAKQVALKYIEYAPRTSAEVRQRLARARYEEEVIERVIADFERAGLLNDAQFSQDWVESRSRTKKYGKTRLANELRRKGISGEMVAEIVESMDEETQFQSALALARTRLSPELAADPAARRRLAAFLQRRGFGWEIIEKVFSALVENIS